MCVFVCMQLRLIWLEPSRSSGESIECKLSWVNWGRDVSAAHWEAVNVLLSVRVILTEFVLYMLPRPNCLTLTKSSSPSVESKTSSEDLWHFHPFTVPQQLLTDVPNTMVKQTLLSCRQCHSTMSCLYTKAKQLIRTDSGLEPCGSGAF